MKKLLVFACFITVYITIYGMEKQGPAYDLVMIKQVANFTDKPIKIEIRDTKRKETNIYSFNPGIHTWNMMVFSKHYQFPSIIKIMDFAYIPEGDARSFDLLIEAGMVHAVPIASSKFCESLEKEQKNVEQIVIPGVTLKEVQNDSPFPVTITGSVSSLTYENRIIQGKSVHPVKIFINPKETKKINVELDPKEPIHISIQHESKRKEVTLPELQVPAIKLMINPEGKLSMMKYTEITQVLPQPSKKGRNVQFIEGDVAEMVEPPLLFSEEIQKELQERRDLIRKIEKEIKLPRSEEED